MEPDSLASNRACENFHLHGVGHNPYPIAGQKHRRPDASAPEERPDWRFGKLPARAQQHNQIGQAKKTRITPNPEHEMAKRNPKFAAGVEGKVNRIRQKHRDRQHDGNAKQAAVHDMQNKPDPGRAT